MSLKKWIDNNLKSSLTAFRLLFIFFVVLIAITISNGNYGSAIWFSLAASNCATLMLFVKQGINYKTLEEQIDSLKNCSN